MLFKKNCATFSVFYPSFRELNLLAYSLIIRSTTITFSFFFSTNSHCYHHHNYQHKLKWIRLHWKLLSTYLELLSNFFLNSSGRSLWSASKANTLLTSVAMIAFATPSSSIRHKKHAILSMLFNKAQKNNSLYGYSNSPSSLKS